MIKIVSEFNEEEAKRLMELSRQNDMSIDAVLRQSLKVYSLCDIRSADNKIMVFQDRKTKEIYT